MKKLILSLLMFLLLPSLAKAQSLANFANIYVGTTVPSSCRTPSMFIGSSSGNVYTCQSSVFVLVGVGGGGLITPSQLPNLVSSNSALTIIKDVADVSFNLTDASCSISGIVNGTAQIFCGNKTLIGDTVNEGSLYVTDYFSTDNPIEITGGACTTSEANVGLFGFDPVTGQPCFSYDGSAPASIGTTPTLDEILDPTANKTFAMADFQTSFTVGTVASFDADFFGTFPQTSIFAFGNADGASTKMPISIWRQNGTEQLAGLSAVVNTSSGNTGNAIFAQGGSIGSDTAFVVTAIRAGNYFTSSGNTNTSAAVMIDQFGNDGAGTIAENIGLSIASMTMGTTNYAIKTGTGLVDFGDSVNTSSGYQVSGAAPSGNCLVGNGTAYVDGSCGGGTTTTIIGNGLTNGGGVTWTGDLNFTVSAAEYLIAGNSYSSIQTNITLDAADVTNPRIDAIIVTDAGIVDKITGTPAATPALPSIDAISELILTFVYVDTSDTVPSNFTNVDVYLEDTEWACTESANLDCASVSNPFAGTKDVEATTAVAGNNVTFVKPAAGTENLSNYTNLNFRIRSKATWANPKSLVLTALNGTTQIGDPVSIRTGNFGFDSSITASYQLVVVPVSLLNTGSNLITTFKFTVAGGGASIGFYIDNVLLQGGTNSSISNTVRFADGIVPTGAINSANQDYVLPQVPNPTTSLKCFGNGLRFQLTSDYTFNATTATITTVGTFQTGDTGLVCDYRY